MVAAHGREATRRRLGREFTIMTNDPTYDEQLTLLAQQDFSHPSSDMPLPGNVNPVDRFQRATGSSARPTTPPCYRNRPMCGRRWRVSWRSCAMCRFPSAPYAEFGVYNTEYRAVVDLTNRLYVFELSTSPNVIWVEFDQLKLRDDSEPYDTPLIGDVTARLQPEQVPF